MKSTTALLIVSLLANLALGAFALTRHHLAATRPASDEPAHAAEARHPAGDSAEPGAEELPWIRLSSGSDQDLVARLRTEGFPPEIIRSILRATVAARFEDRRRAIREMRRQLPWWSSSSRYVRDTPATTAAQHALNRDVEDVVSAALGIDASLFTDEDRARARRSLGNLPLDKISTLRSIGRDYDALFAALDAEKQGVTLAADRERAETLNREQRREVEQLLTPEELEDYDRHTSSAAHALRWSLRCFDTTEDEYLALYEIRKQFDARFKEFATTDKELREARAAAKPEYDAAIATALGPQRFQEYEIKTAPSYGEVQSLVDDYDLPRTVADEVVAAQLTLTRRAEQIRNDSQLGTDERARALTALAEEASARLTAALGSKAFGTYSESAGKWIEQLRRSPSP